MEGERNKQSCSLLMWTLIVGLLSQNLLMCIASFDDQKTYYTPDPRTPPSGGGSHGSPPSHGSAPSGGYGSPPTHGDPPTHESPPSYHGRGSPPADCGIPPPSGGHHHHHNPFPAPPTGGGRYHDPPSTPTPTPTTPTPTPTIVSPPSGGGGYHDPPSTPTPTTPTPTTPTPTIVTPPSGGGGYHDPPSTPTPTIGSPPYIVPGTPAISFPPFDPNSPPFSGTCNFWGSHPGLIWGIFGWWGTLGHTFGISSLPGSGATMTLPHALTNPAVNGFGALYREGTAALLNSLVNNRFPYTTQQVKNRFTAGVSSNKAATAQAHLFKLANEGRIKPRF